MKTSLLALFLICSSVLFTVAQRVCDTHTYLEQSRQSNPALSQHISDVENFINQAAHKESGENEGLSVIKIPVVVHVLYNNASQNISDAQIQSQIDVLNKDFRRRNADTGNVPARFRSLAADCYIEFALAVIDPRGRATNGIVRKKTSIQMFNLDDRIKSSSIGGDDPWNPDNYLNIWVGPLAGSLLGYASVVGGPKEKDGVAISYGAFGATGTGTYGLGRTGTHEIGHWLGLRHIWGDRYCGDDYVGDTPPQQTSSFGCPSGIVTTCNNGVNGNMYMNFMDLSNDACLNMFTIGQRDRMRALFMDGGPRKALLSSNGLTGTPGAESAPAPLPETATAGNKVVQIFPNPVTSMVSVNMDGDMNGRTLTVYSQLGQAVLVARITKNKMQLDVHHLKEGLYYLQISGVKKMATMVKVGGSL